MTFRRVRFLTFIVVKTVRLLLWLLLVLMIIVPLLHILNKWFQIGAYQTPVGVFFHSVLWEMLGLAMLVTFLTNAWDELNRRLGRGVLWQLLAGR